MKTFEGLKEEFTRYTFSLVLNLKYYMLSLRTAKLLFYVIADRQKTTNSATSVLN